ncbi:MAG: hypothetical protein U5L45_09005 [Saprospiraceae bacterium]|nr:hypothetical protein [Saprospiraceae bacterium]
MVHFSGKARKMNQLPFFCERSEQKCTAILLGNIIAFSFVLALMKNGSYLEGSIARFARKKEVRWFIFRAKRAIEPK